MFGDVSVPSGRKGQAVDFWSRYVFTLAAITCIKLENEGPSSGASEGSREAPQPPPADYPEETNGSLQRRFFTGTVTSVTSGESGMINECVYFEMAAVLGGLKLETGDKVHVTAERKHSKAGWRAVRCVNCVYIMMYVWMYVCMQGGIDL